MSAGKAIEVAIQLEPTEPISGWLRSSDGDSRAFTGWLEFNSAIQSLIEEADARSGSQPGEVAGPS